jgi:hypothetical protein
LHAAVRPGLQERRVIPVRRASRATRVRLVTQVQPGRRALLGLPVLLAWLVLPVLPAPLVLLALPVRLPP